MAELSESERKQAQALAAEALADEEAAAPESAETAADLGDVKDFFCKNWPMIKRVLQFIAGKVGGRVSAIVRALIAAGDFVHGRLCR